MADTRRYHDRAEYIKRKVIERRKRLKQLSVEYKGGRCIYCGYHRCVEALEFHHQDETTKGFGLSSRGLTRAWKIVQRELDKCILVCANCHREIHAGLLQPLVETTGSEPVFAMTSRKLRQASKGKRR